MATFGAERSITLCRELTKLHEEITKTTIGEAVRYYEQNDPAGKYVLVMGGTLAAPAAAEEVTLRRMPLPLPRPAGWRRAPCPLQPQNRSPRERRSAGDIYKELIAAKDEGDREEESE